MVKHKEHFAFLSKCTRKNTHTYALGKNVFDSTAKFLNFVCQFVGVALVLNEVKQKV